MTAVKRNTKAIVAACFGGAFVLAIGGRLAYIELARSDMADYDRKIAGAIADPQLKAAWDRKLQAIEDKYAAESRRWGDCDQMSDEKPDARANAAVETWIVPWAMRSPVSERQACYSRRAGAQSQSDLFKSMDIDALGPYQVWAIEQSGVDRYHRWNKYPADIKSRLRQGQRGLMLGPFWNYIL